MKKSDTVYLYQLLLFLAWFAGALYLALTIEMYPLNFLWFGFAALLGLIGIMRGLAASLIAALFVLFGYGSWVLYRLYIEKSIAEVTFNDLVWILAFPAGTLVSGLYGKQLAALAEQAAANGEKMQERVMKDEVTGLVNHRQFLSDLHEEISRCIRYKHAMTLALIQVSHYKELWKTYGKTTGDEILKQVSVRMEEALRDVEKAYLGDGLFAAILPETPRHNAEIVKNRLQEAIMRTEFTATGRGKKLKIKLKIGLAGCPEDGEDAAALYDIAKVGTVYDAG